MTTPRESRARAVNALAALVHEIRPEWDPPGIVAALRAVPESVTLANLTIAAAKYAADDRNWTPAHLADLGNHAWDSTGFVPCPTHPRAGHRVSGECADCWTDRKADLSGFRPDRGGRPPSSPVRRQLVAAVRRPTEGATA